MRSNSAANGCNYQHYESKAGIAANDLTCQQYEPQFREESWTTATFPIRTKILSRMASTFPGGGTDLKLHLVLAVAGSEFALPAEVFFLRAFGSMYGGLETTATRLHASRDEV